MKKRIIIFLLTIMLLSNVAIAYNWSDIGTYSLSAWQGYKRYTTEGEKLYALKSTDSEYFDVDTYTKTMWTSPLFRLVNSDNEIRSMSVSTANSGERATGNGNTGSEGYYYYASIKPTWNQLGTDTIKLDFTPR